MDYTLLSELLFPNVTLTPEDMEARYPKRELPEGAKVTRFAPSPTGFVHFGGLFPSTVGERLAHQSGGVFYLRIEDTDAKREVPGAAEGLIKTLERYGVNFDEGAVLDENGCITYKGNYGPYKQSDRAEIYHVYAKKLVAEGKAYPCFTTEEELRELHSVDKKAEIKQKEWTEEEMERQKAEMLKLREITVEEVKEHLANGDKFVLRMLSNGDPDKKIKITDLVKGTLEIPENDKDEVLLKSDGIPTYHFAHAVDDHLMGTTHVIRGEEWLPSLSRHIMLFNYLGFKLPKYMHIAQIMRLDEEGNKKKLSKRDMGANMEDYARMGYAPICVREYILTLLNSNFEEWHMQNPEKSCDDFPFNIKKMSSSGCLFDFDKLNNISKNVISKMTAEEVYEAVSEWAKEFDPEFHAIISREREKTIKILSIGRGGKKPRKDLTVWTDVKPYLGFFFDELFKIEDSYPENFSKNEIKKLLSDYLNTYSARDDQTEWFNDIKAVAEANGYASDMKAYKANPEAYKGSVADVSMFIRVAITGKLNSPDMFEVTKILGEEKVKERLSRMADSL